MKKKILVVLSILLALYVVGSVVAVQIIYATVFVRVPPQAISAFPLYRDVAQEYPREEVSFLSGENRLTGWVYGEDNDDALVVMAHGLGSTAESYLPYAIWFVDQGYRVFSYDATGTGASEGEDTTGLSQSVLDLDSALTYIESNPELSELPVLLFGHSWGGYAVARVLAYDHDITASVSISAFDTPMDMVCEAAEEYCGPFAYGGYPFLYLQQRILFADAANGSAAEAVEASGIPILVIHGTADEVISYEEASLLSYLEEGDNVTLLTLDGEDHMSLLEPQGEVYTTYVNACHAQYELLWDQYGGVIPEEVQAAHYAAIDKSITGGVNEDLAAQIDAFYRQALSGK